MGDREDLTDFTHTPHPRPRFLCEEASVLGVRRLQDYLEVYLG